MLAIGGNGVDSDHPDLINYFWRGPADASIGYNFADDCSDVPSTLEHHGTHCTGIAATKTNNKIGIAGVANTNGPVPNVELMILPPYTIDNRGSLSNALRALNFAVEHDVTYPLIPTGHHRKFVSWRRRSKTPQVSSIIERAHQQETQNVCCSSVNVLPLRDSKAVRVKV